MKGSFAAAHRSSLPRRAPSRHASSGPKGAPDGAATVNSPHRAHVTCQLTPPRQRPAGLNRQLSGSDGRRLPPISPFSARQGELCGSSTRGCSPTSFRMPRQRSSRGASRQLDETLLALGMLEAAPLRAGLTGAATSAAVCPGGGGRRSRSSTSRRPWSGRPLRGAPAPGWDRCPVRASGVPDGRRPTSRPTDAAPQPRQSRLPGQARCAGPSDPSVCVRPARAATRAATASGLLNSSKLCTRR